MLKKYALAATLALSSLQLSAQNNQAINLNFMDKTVRPQDDFYNYVNGNWMKTAEIPSDRARWGSFDELRENTDIATLKILLESLKTTYPKGSDGQKIADLFSSYVNFDKRNEIGLAPIQPYLQKIDNIQNMDDLYKYLVEVTPYHFNPFFDPSIDAHLKNSNINTVYLGGASLGLGKTYYQVDDERNEKMLGEYTKFINQIFSKTGQKTRDFKGPKIVTFEKQLASKMLTVVQERDMNKIYNPIAVKDLKDIVKNIDLSQFLNDLGYKADTVIVTELEYFKNLDNNFKSDNIETLKDVLRFAVINDAASNLTQELDDLNFDFYGKTLNGQKEQREINKRGLAFVNAQAGDLLGKLYVKEHFPAQAKTEAEELVKYLIKSFEVHIKNLAWMSPETKVKALEKLSKFTVKIGYPNEWKDYSKLEVSNSLFDNILAYRKWKFEKSLAKQGKPVDKTEWMMTPQTVNAYYNPLYNEIVFPAAILQAPFYDYHVDAAVNFGGIGAVIGHEISHGFDDSGSQFDGDGNLNNWWTAKDKEKFEKATLALANQYNAYQPAPGVFVNGKFTLGENIGDLGGASVAYDALQMYLKDKGNPGLIDGFTPQQRFFLSWGTIWRTKTTEEFVINQVKTDPHSPAQYRSFGPLVNINGFYEAFKIKKGDKLFIPKKSRITIW